MLFSPVIYKPWLDSVIINKELISFLSSKSATDSSHAHWHLTHMLFYSESLGLYTAWPGWSTWFPWVVRLFGKLSEV